MGYVRYDEDRVATARWLRRDPELALVVASVASDAADEARAVVYREAFDTGALAASIEVERDDGRDRIGYAVVADDPAAAPTEYGNARMPAEQVVAFLIEGAERAGLTVHGDG